MSAKLTFLGHASFAFQTPEKTVLIDPWMEGNPKCPPEWKKPEKVDYVVVTHGHSDHLDPALPELVARTGATVVTLPEVKMYLETLGVTKFLGGNYGTVVDEGITFTMTQAYHHSHITDREGKRGYSHCATGYVISAGPGMTVYHAGDTGVFGDMKLIGELYQPDIALLPIGGGFTMDPREAAYAARLIGAKLAIPMHFGTFPMLRGTAEEFLSHLSGPNDPMVKVLCSGECVVIPL